MSDVTAELAGSGIPGDINAHPEVVANEARLHIAERNAEVLRRERRRSMFRKVLIGGLVVGGVAIAAHIALPILFGKAAVAAHTATVFGQSINVGAQAGTGILGIPGLGEGAIATISAIQPALMGLAGEAIGAGAVLATIGGVGAVATR